MGSLSIAGQRPLLARDGSILIQMLRGYEILVAI
jgi:hypothetical protein